MKNKGRKKEFNKHNKGISWSKIIVFSLIVSAGVFYGLNSSELENINLIDNFVGPSIEDVATNSSGYLGEEVTVSGKVRGMAGRPLNVDRELQSPEGYAIGLKCNPEGLDFQYETSYSITGEVKKTSYQDILTQERKTVYYIDCSEVN